MNKEDRKLHLERVKKRARKTEDNLCENKSYLEEDSMYGKVGHVKVDALGQLRSRNL